MSLASTKRRISSIQSTWKITNAMKLIASSKLSKQTKKFIKAKDYFQEYYGAIANLLSLTDNKDFNIVANNEKTLWIVISSNLGLCGGYNINMYKEIHKDAKPDDVFCVFGKKGNDHFRKHYPKATFWDTSFIDVDGDVTFEMCSIIGKEVFEKLILGEFAKVKICYTKFINAISFKPNIVSVFPFDEQINQIQKEKPPRAADYDFEPNRKAIIKGIIPEYISMITYASIIESILSECASRRNAMDTATTNADELINKYKLQYNRMRQATITNEIIEIVAGNEDNE